MRKKMSAMVRRSDELGRLLTRERLARAGVPDASPSAGADPDLDAIFKRVRASAKKKSKAPTVKRDVVRKLVGG